MQSLHCFDGCCQNSSRVRHCQWRCHCFWYRQCGIHAKSIQRSTEVPFSSFHPHYLHGTHYEFDWRCLPQTLHRLEHLYDVLQSDVLHGRGSQEKIPVLFVWQTEWQYTNNGPKSMWYSLELLVLCSTISYWAFHFLQGISAGKILQSIS